MRPYWFADVDCHSESGELLHSHLKVLCICQPLSRDFYHSAMIYARWYHPSYCICNTKLLAQKSGDRVISWRMDNPWAAHSPDLNLPCSLGLRKRQSQCWQPNNTSESKDMYHQIYHSNPCRHIRELLETLQSGWINIWTVAVHKLNIIHECQKTLKNWGKIRNEH